MSYEAATLAITLLFFTSIVLALAYYFAPVGECSECGHCRNLRLEKQKKQEASNHEYEHRMNLVECEDESCPVREKTE